MKTLINDLQDGNKVTQAKVFLTLLAVSAVLIAVMQLTGIIHLNLSK